MTLYTKLFDFKYLKEEEDKTPEPQAPSPMPQTPPGPAPDDDGLISPYSVPRKDVTAIAIDSMEEDGRIIGMTIGKTHNRISPSLNLLKNIDPKGFIEFKGRVKDALELNNVLKEDALIREQLADIFTWAYASIEKNSGFLIYSDDRQASKIAQSIINIAKKAGLSFKNDKIMPLFYKLLKKVLKKPETKTQDGGPK